MLKLGTWIGLACLLILTGCATRIDVQDSQSDTLARSSHLEQVDPNQRLFEQVHSGRFQLDSALDSIEVAYRKARDAEAQTTDPTAKERMKMVVQILDETGRAMAEHGGAEPTLEDVKADPESFVKKRENLVNDCNDSLHDLRDAREALATLKREEVSPDVDRHQELSDLIGVAMEDLRSVIHALGGQEEVPSDTP